MIFAFFYNPGSFNLPPQRNRVWISSIMIESSTVSHKTQIMKQIVGGCVLSTPKMEIYQSSSCEGPRVNLSLFLAWKFFEGKT